MIYVTKSLFINENLYFLSIFYTVDYKNFL